MRLSILMPIYNEENTIKEILRRVKEANVKNINDKEIIIINDGSTDGTKEILENIEQPGIKIIHLNKNRGKGWAIREGMKSVTGDIVIIQDGDLEYHPDDYNDLIQPIIVDGYEVVYGSRLLNKDNEISYFVYSFGGRLLTLITNLLYHSHITDEPTGYKVFKTNVLKSIDLKCKKFEFCPEVTAKILKKGINIKEVPIRYSPRKISEGKKIRWYVGLDAIWILFKYRFVD